MPYRSTPTRWQRSQQQAGNKQHEEAGFEGGYTTHSFSGRFAE